MSGIKGQRNKNSYLVDKMVDLHVNQHMSTSQIAKELNTLKNNVISSLRNRGVLRKSAGYASLLTTNYILLQERKRVLEGLDDLPANRYADKMGI